MASNNGGAAGRRPDDRRPPDRWLAAAGAAAAAAGLAYVVWRVLVRPVGEVDFRFFWLAGRLWAAGIDPYGPRFEAIGARLLPPGNVVHYWFYPPQWWPICRALAALDLARATAAWRLANAAMLVAGTALLVLALAGGGRERRLGLAGLACGFALLIEPSANLLAFGQSAAYLYLALCLVATGVLRRRWMLVAAGLLLSTFKPQVGALLFLGLLPSPRHWPAIAAALLAALLLALPALIGFGAIATLREFLANLHAWGVLPSNTLLTASGPLHLLARIASLPLGPQAGMVPALAATLAAGWLLRRRADAPLAPLLLLAAAIVGLVPLHIYDMTLQWVAILLAIAWAGRPRAPAIVAALLLIRPGKIEEALGVPTYGSNVSGGLIGLSVAGLILLAVAIHACWVDRRAR